MAPVQGKSCRDRYLLAHAWNCTTQCGSLICTHNVMLFYIIPGPDPKRLGTISQSLIDTDLDSNPQQNRSRGRYANRITVLKVLLIYLSKISRRKITKVSTHLKSQQLCNPDYFGTQKESGTTSNTINKSIEFKGWLFVELVSSNGTMEDNREVLQNKTLSGKIVNKYLNRPLEH